MSEMRVSSELGDGAVSAPASCERLGRVEQVDAALVRHCEHLLRYLHVERTLHRARNAIMSKLRLYVFIHTVSCKLMTP